QAMVTVDETQLARDLWPSGMGRLTNDKDELKDLPSWRVVPSTFEGLCQWLFVDRDDGQSTVLIHPEHHDQEKLQVTLRLQGIVADANLNALGNWNGDVLHAPKAVQTLTILGGSCKEPFGAQQRTLAHIRELVLKLLCLPSAAPSQNGHNIVLKRRVFTKVQSSSSSSDTPSALTTSDDPAGRALKIVHMWNVDHRIMVGVQREDGTIARANPLVIRRGDLIDVAATIQVISMRTRHTRKTEILFCPKEVVRLASAATITVS
ncbi:hypothetical protein C2E23DRAFT_740292, partial [Lenzites betulinus]